VFSGKTDAKGEIRDIAVISMRYSQETKDPRRISSYQKGPFTIRIKSEGVLVSRKIALDANASVSIELSSAGR
jgi:hypothetical protein